MFATLCLLASLLAQNGYDREASARDYVQFLVLQLDQWTRSFPGDYNAALLRPPVDVGKLPEAARSGATDLRESIVRLGELSFAFYMIHLLVLRAGINLLGKSPHFGVAAGLTATAVAFTVALGLAWLLYEGVENPARELLLRRRGGKSKPPVTEQDRGVVRGR